MEKQNALFIHGLHGAGYSATGDNVRESLKDSYNVFLPEFEIRNIKATLESIDRFVKENDIRLVIGSSLGAFYTLYYKCSLPKIVINPCMKPTAIASKFTKEISAELVEEMRTYENRLYLKEVTMNDHVVGLFANADELLGDRFKPLFAEYYGAENILEFEGGHNADERICDALNTAARMLMG